MKDCDDDGGVGIDPGLELWNRSRNAAVDDFSLSSDFVDIACNRCSYMLLCLHYGFIEDSFVTMSQSLSVLQGCDDQRPNCSQCDDLHVSRTS